MQNRAVQFNRHAVNRNTFNSNTILRFAVAAIVLAALSFSASAQNLEHANFSAGAGFTVPAYDAGTRLNDGWNLDFRGGVRISEAFLADLDFTYTHSRFNDTTLASFGEPDGGIGIWSLTFQPVVRLAPRSAGIQPYLTAGYGLYHLNFTVTQPETVQTVFCSGFFGCYPAFFGTNAVVATNSVYKAGFNGGVGFDIPMHPHSDSRTRIFAEARYNQMFMSSGADVQYIPVTFGIRW
jgi:hypothetical protein